MPVCVCLCVYVRALARTHAAIHAVAVYSCVLTQGFFCVNMCLYLSGCMQVTVYVYVPLCIYVCVCFSYPPLEMLAEWRWLPCVARRAGWGQSSPDALSDSGHHSLTSPWGGDRETEGAVLGDASCVFVCVHACKCVCLYEFCCGVLLCVPSVRVCVHEAKLSLCSLSAPILSSILLSVFLLCLFILE